MLFKDLLPGDRFRFLAGDVHFVWTLHQELNGNRSVFGTIVSFSDRVIVQEEWLDWEVELVDEFDHLKHLIHECVDA